MLESEFRGFGWIWGIISPRGLELDLAFLSVMFISCDFHEFQINKSSNSYFDGSGEFGTLILFNLPIWPTLCDRREVTTFVRVQSFDLRIRGVERAFADLLYELFFRICGQ
ncbi:hypothetical protein H5410_021005 [Solanum commersonii]|uniref:Uncharacterized protein n=1 Tax=Solanum commersonii TaxID=4109 RepID=A0A9J5ZDX4_SOLCO|nr:hypothetical protein H5410_021005 [Solanum commersonii]